MKRYKLKKTHRFIKDSTKNPDFTYTIFEEGEEITEIPYSELTYGQRKTIKVEKERGKHFIWAYDPKKIMLRFWRLRDLELIKPKIQSFAPTRKRKK